MKNFHRDARAICVLLAGLMSSPLAMAADPQLEKAVRQGGELFRHATFDGNGRVCESCHLSGGSGAGRLPDGKALPSLANAAAIFPRYRARDGRVVTLSDQVVSCIAGGLQGNPPAYGSEQLNALVSYLTSLSAGKTVDMGGKPQ